MLWSCMFTLHVVDNSRCAQELPRMNLSRCDSALSELERVSLRTSTNVETQHSAREHVGVATLGHARTHNTIAS